MSSWPSGAETTELVPEASTCSVVSFTRVRPSCQAEEVGIVRRAHDLVQEGQRR